MGATARPPMSHGVDLGFDPQPPGDSSDEPEDGSRPKLNLNTGTEPKGERIESGNSRESESVRSTRSTTFHRRNLTNSTSRAVFPNIPFLGNGFRVGSPLLFRYCICNRFKYGIDEKRSH